MKMGRSWWALAVSAVVLAGCFAGAGSMAEPVEMTEPALVGIWQDPNGAETVLTFYIGDPDLNDRFVYRRCGATCPTATPSQ